MIKKKLIQYPNLVKEWDGKKNIEVDINKITYGVQRKFWWICKKNKSHSWQASANNRTTKGSGCPFCSNQRVHKENNLKYLYPKVANEWDIKKNNDLKPENIKAKTQMKYWWRCKYGHSWKTQVYLRTIKKTNCPYCVNQKVSDTNNLAFQFPKISKEFDLKKNKYKSPSSIISKSNKKYWWICKKNHSYLTSPGGRIQGRGCPYCAGKKVDQSNSLRKRFPNISKEWNYKKNGMLQPDKVTAGSKKSIWWICRKGHEWKTSVASRTGASKTGCPYCSNRKVDEYNNLLNNFPKIASEWHPNKNGKITPKEIVYGSNKNVWWICQNGHEWKAQVNSRTGLKGTGCPRCSKRISSFEIRILSELESFFSNIKPIYKLKGTEIDLLLKDHNIGIEYDGWYFHKNRIQKDKVKNEFLKKNNIDLIRIREAPLKKISNKDIIIKQNELKKSDLNKLLNAILNISQIKDKKITKYLTKKSFQQEKKYRKYLSFYPAPIPQKSLSESHAYLVKEWDFKKNFPLKPKNFYTNSGTKVWWKCNNGHSWKIRIANRTGKGNTGCPYCSGKIINADNNLEKLFPIVAQEFHKNKNGGLKPKNLSPGSHKKYWWKCNKGHEWKAIIKSRTEQKTGCPYCSGHLATKDTNLKKLHPKIVKEWDFIKNGKLDPSKLRPSSNLKVWWKCNKGHSWYTRISGRTLKKTGCIYCANIKVSNTNNLLVVSPKLALEWHPTKNKPLEPKDIIAKTGKKYWWKCKNGHEWQNSPANRFSRGCPFCGKHYVTYEKSLKYKYPELAKEWHPNKNKAITPDKIHANSNKKVWWKCKKGHEFSAVVSNRHQRNKISKCKFCKSLN